MIVWECGGDVTLWGSGGVVTLCVGTVMLDYAALGGCQARSTTR